MVPVGVGIVRLPIELIDATYLEMASNISKGDLSFAFMVKKDELPLMLIVDPEYNRMVPSVASGILILWSLPLVLTGGACCWGGTNLES
jgi:hypothetical protein